MRRSLPAAALAFAALAAPATAADPPGKLKVLVIDGQNNHRWAETTPIMKKALEDSGRFAVDVATAPAKPKPPALPKNPTADQKKAHEAALAALKPAEAEYKPKMAAFRPEVERYDAVLLNYNGDDWSPEFARAFDAAVGSGKVGLVIVHAANNSFRGWAEYDRMIGMGWRDAKYGDRLYLDDAGKEVREAKGQGQGSGHRYTGPFTVTLRDGDHPVVRGMPAEWLHARDELYDNMRGPVEKVHLIATAYSDKAKKGTGVHEPMIWTVAYGRGRVFHTPMGHDPDAMRCVGFQAVLCRGTEWAATGKVTLPVPANFPTADKTSVVGP